MARRQHRSHVPAGLSQADEKIFGSVCLFRRREQRSYVTLQSDDKNSRKKIAA